MPTSRRPAAVSTLLRSAEARDARLAELASRDWVAATRSRTEGTTRSMPGVSVIVPTYRGVDRITACLDALRTQDIDSALVETIVVVNGPDDGTAAVLDSYAAEHRDFTLRVIRVARPSAGLARNLALAAAVRDYVTFVDDDDVVEQGFLSALYAVASPTAIAIAPLLDVRPDGTVDEVSSLAGRMRALLDEQRSDRVSDAPWVLGFNACKLIPRRLATRARYAADLRSGEDVAYMAALLAYPLHLAFARGEGPHAYRRTLRAASVSRRERDFDFCVADRLAVLRHLDGITATTENAAALAFLRRAQTSFIREYLDAHPADAGRVDDALEASGVRNLPWNVVNGKATDLALLYCFPPFLDPSGVVAAKVLADRGRVVDVVSANMSAVRQRDDSTLDLARRWLGLRAIVPCRPAFGDWPSISEFAQRASARAMEWVKTRGAYENLYTRALWVGSHVAGALFALDQPDVRWTAEFSDPLGRGVDAQRRVGVLVEDEVTAILRAAVAARGVDVPDGVSLFEFVEIVTYTLADELIFTNANQRDYMLSLVSDEVAELARAKSVVRPHPAPRAAAYDLADSDVEFDSARRQIGYFGSFYGNRTLDEIFDAISASPAEVRSQVQFQIFCDKPDALAEAVAERGLDDVVVSRPYAPYFEFLHLTRRLDALLVRDAETVGVFPKNPFLPSKYSDYKGSGTAVWGVVEPGSPLDGMPLDHRSEVGDVTSIRRVIEEIALAHP